MIQNYCALTLMIILNNYLLRESPDALSKSFCMDAGIMSMLAILSPFFSLIATAPLVFLPSDRIWITTWKHSNVNKNIISLCYHVYPCHLVHIHTMIIAMTNLSHYNIISIKYFLFPLFHSTSPLRTKHKD